MALQQIKASNEAPFTSSDGVSVRILDIDMRWRWIPSFICPSLLRDRNTFLAITVSIDSLELIVGTPELAPLDVNHSERP